MDKSRVARLVNNYRLTYDFVGETFTWVDQSTCSFYVKVDADKRFVVLVVEAERHFFIPLPHWEIMIQTGGRLING